MTMDTNTLVALVLIAFLFTLAALVVFMTAILYGRSAHASATFVDRKAGQAANMTITLPESSPSGYTRPPEG